MSARVEVDDGVSGPGDEPVVPGGTSPMSRLVRARTRDLFRRVLGGAGRAARESERVERVLAQLIFRLPQRTMRRIAGGARVRVDGRELHAEIQLLIALRNKRGALPLTAGTAEEMRARFRRECLLHPGPRVDVRAHDLDIDVSAFRGGSDTGPAQLRARHYAPPRRRRDVGRAKKEPVLVFVHGGGFVVGDLDTHDLCCRLLCKHARVHVLSVAYRLAPENPFPAPLDDALAAFRWARAHAGELGADETRVAIGGDSAGGHLAAVVAQEVARAGERAPEAQLLLYPAIDRKRTWPSTQTVGSGFLLETNDIEKFEAAYVGFEGDVGELGLAAMHDSLPDALKDDLRLRPLDALASLDVAAGALSPAVVVTCGFDPLRDEGDAYARALFSRGDRVIARRFDALVHGFANLASVSGACRRALVDVAHDLREILA